MVPTSVRHHSILSWLVFKPYGTKAVIILQDRSRSLPANYSQRRIYLLKHGGHLNNLWVQSYCFIVFFVLLNRGGNGKAVE